MAGQVPVNGGKNYPTSTAGARSQVSTHHTQSGVTGTGDWTSRGAVSPLGGTNVPSGNAGSRTQEFRERSGRS